MSRLILGLERGWSVESCDYCCAAQWCFNISFINFLHATQPHVPRGVPLGWSEFSSFAHHCNMAPQRWWQHTHGTITWAGDKDPEASASHLAITLLWKSPGQIVSAPMVFFLVEQDAFILVSSLESVACSFTAFLPLLITNIEDINDQRSLEWEAPVPCVTDTFPANSWALLMNWVLKINNER